MDPTPPDNFFGFSSELIEGRQTIRPASSETCIGVLWVQDICHFTSRDMGCIPFYFQGYGILFSIFCLLSEISGYGDICYGDTCCGDICQFF